jgi:hypothetical protein
MPSSAAHTLVPKLTVLGQDDASWTLPAAPLVLPAGLAALSSRWRGPLQGCGYAGGRHEPGRR